MPQSVEVNNVEITCRDGVGTRRWDEQSQLNESEKSVRAGVTLEIVSVTEREMELAGSIGRKVNSVRLFSILNFAF